jgi:flavin reductase (DIM6/NTAB) family NADH-FMN oxidoreductase RutF/DNA-binding IclR family transcriptional regulator
MMMDAMADEQPVIDPTQYRQVLGQYPTGVCVVTSTGADGAPAAMVVGSFTSVSLDPPLIGFFPDRGSSSWPKVAASGRFCINILSAEQEGVCRKLASKDPEKLAGIGHRHSPLGSPIIDGVVAWIDCDSHSVQDAGDHFFVLGSVRHLEIADSGLPLLFFQGGYGRFAPSSLAASNQNGLLTVPLRLVDRARPQMEALASELDAVCVASARVGNEVVIIASAGQPRSRSTTTLVGQHLPFVPPTGSIFAAWLDDAELTKWIGPSASADRAKTARAAVECVRKRGFSVGLASDAQRAFAAKLHELASSGTTGGTTDLADLISGLSFDPPAIDETTAQRVRLISAPVWDAEGQVAFALTIHDFDRPLSPADVTRLADRLAKTTADASAAIEARA